MDTEDYYHEGQALPIGTHIAGTEPQDGLQYLSMVHSEASTIPDVITADRSKFNCCSNVETTPDCNTSVQQLPPQLVQREMRKFSELRQYCRRMSDMYPEKRLTDTPQELLAPSKRLFDKEPRLPLLLSLSQETIFGLLCYIEEVCLSDMEESRVPTAITSWVWSLFCVVDRPVPMDYMAVIRGIGRRCGVLSTPITPNSDTKFLVLFIVVCHYFEQRDLLQELGVV